MTGLFYWQVHFDYMHPEKNPLADPGPIVHASGGLAERALTDEELSSFKRLAYHYAFRTLVRKEHSDSELDKLHRGVVWFERESDMPDIFLDYGKKFDASVMEIFFMGRWKNILEEKET